MCVCGGGAFVPQEGCGGQRATIWSVPPYMSLGDRNQVPIPSEYQGNLPAEPSLQP